MNIEIRKVQDIKEVYDHMSGLAFPYKYKADPGVWESSYSHDIDGSGSTLFSELETMGAYSGSRLVGFIQYGRTAFGFDESGEISDAVSYPVIRNFFFSEDQTEAGGALLNEAVNALSAVSSGRIYAFFHYFGMSCYARHGKLHDSFTHIHEMLIRNGFCVEHENVFYSSELNSASDAEIKLEWHDETPGRQRYCDFILDNAIVGGCEVHFLEQSGIAYLRWIYINGDLCGRGLGSRSMSALKSDLFRRGITRFDTDTALTNIIAQRFYEKNGFRNEGLTRSYYK